MWRDIKDAYNLFKPWIDGATYMERHRFNMATSMCLVSLVMNFTLAAALMAGVVIWWPVYIMVAFILLFGYGGVSQWRRTRLDMEQRFANERKPHA